MKAQHTPLPVAPAALHVSNLTQDCAHQLLPLPALLLLLLLLLLPPLCPAAITPSPSRRRQRRLCCGQGGCIRARHLGERGSSGEVTGKRGGAVSLAWGGSSSEVLEHEGRVQDLEGGVMGCRGWGGRWRGGGVKGRGGGRGQQGR